MASSKQPPPDNHDNKKHQPHSPVTSSPLNPATSTSPARRNTISPGQPTASAKPPCATRHRRRRTWSSISPTERLLRYKAAAAWRSATTLQRHTIQPPPHTYDNNSNSNSGNDTPSNNTKTTTSPPSNPNQNDKPDFHVVILNPPQDDDKPPPTTVPAKYHTLDCTDYTAVFRPRHRRGHMYSSSRGSTIAKAGTTLQCVSVAAAVLLLGVYLVLRVLVAVCHGQVLLGGHVWEGWVSSDP